MEAVANSIEELPADVKQALEIYRDWMNQTPFDQEPPITLDDFFTYEFPVRYTRSEVHGYPFILIWCDPIKDEGGSQLLVVQTKYWLQGEVEREVANITQYFDSYSTIIYNSGVLVKQES